MSDNGKQWPKGTSWDHGDHNGRHERFMLSCDEFRALAIRANGHCEICFHPARLDQLVIDHDHAISSRAVRGLLCHKCNLGLASVDNGSRPADAHEVRYLGSAFHLNLPATRPRLTRGTSPHRQTGSGRFGSAKCPRCRRTVNFNEHGMLNIHLGRVGKDRDKHGDAGCSGWPAWKPLICQHGSAISDRDNLCRLCWKCDCISGSAPNCPIHGRWTDADVAPTIQIPAHLATDPD